MNGAYRCSACHAVVKNKVGVGNGVPWCCGAQMVLIATWCEDLPDEFVEW